MKKKLFTAIGLMSGTSMDGVDLSIIRSDGYDQFCNILDDYYEYDKELQDQLINLRELISIKDDLSKYIDKLRELERKFTLFNANLVNQTLKKLKYSVDLVGFHGQTIFHNSQTKITKQLGDGKLLSQLTKKKVVYDFRQNDINNGGEGAPLTPIFHKYLIKSKKIELPACMLNIGGISNLTVIHNLNNHEIKSEDVGPGNCLINAWIQNYTNEKFDLEGRISNMGKINEIILEQALETHENNFQRRKNISLDINDFDISFARGLNLEDGAATLTAFTAESINRAYRNFLPRMPKESFLSGGGSFNKELRRQIGRRLPEVQFRDFSELGQPAEAREAIGFAVLGNQFLVGESTTFPGITGNQTSVILGKLSLPN